MARILVGRLGPSGIRREDLVHSEWLKDVARDDRARRGPVPGEGRYTTAGDLHRSRGAGAFDGLGPSADPTGVELDHLQSVAGLDGPLMPAALRCIEHHSSYTDAS